MLLAYVLNTPTVVAAVVAAVAKYSPRIVNRVSSFILDVPLCTQVEIFTLHADFLKIVATLGPGTLLVFLVFIGLHCLVMET